MKKIHIILIFSVFIASVLFFVVALSYSHKQSSKLEELVSTNDALTSHVEAGKQEKVQNSVLIDKIDNDPNQIAKDAKKKAETFIDVVKKNNNKADKDKSQAYKSELKDCASENLRNSSDLLSINIPKDYDIDISTQRGETVPVLLSSDTKYIVLGYDAYADEIAYVKEYKVS